jgi:hypothetical protein
MPAKAGPNAPTDASPVESDASFDDVRPPHPVALATTTATPTPPRPAVVEPLSPARSEVAFTADQEMRDMLERLQALMHSSVPDGDLAAVLKVAVREKLERLEAKRFGKRSTTMERR